MVFWPLLSREKEQRVEVTERRLAFCRANLLVLNALRMPAEGITDLMKKGLRRLRPRGDLDPQYGLSLTAPQRVRVSTRSTRTVFRLV